MKRKLIKEQNTAPQSVNATNKVHDNLLVLAKQYCDINTNGTYEWRNYPGTTTEVLARQRKEDSGWNYIINKDGSNQVWLVKMKADAQGTNIMKEGLLEDCQEKISAYAPKPLTSIQNQIIDHFVETKGYLKTRPNQGEIDNGKWQVIDMNSLDQTNFPKPNVAFVYKQSNLENKLKNQYPEVQTALLAAGYTFDVPIATSVNFDKGKSILSVLPGVKYQQMFKNNPPNVYPTGEKTVATGKEDIKKLVDDWKSKNVKRGDCRAAIKALYHDFANPGDTYLQDDSQVMAFKDIVYLCKTRKDFAGGILGVGDELKTLFTKSSTQNKYGMRDYRPTGNIQAESKNESKLKNLIRESLITAKETKTKTLLGESKIVTSRFTIISEGRKLKTKKDLNKFFGEVISEMSYLNTQGFNKEIINEGFWDMLKGIFGHTPDGVLEYFKEYVGKWLVQNLTPIDPEGWVGSVIITAIGNLPVGDIPKLTDCNYLTKLVAKSVGEGALRKISHEKGVEGPFYDILRNTLVDSLEENSFVQKLEEGLGNILCPLIGGLSSKMDSAASTLKQKALSA